MVNSTMERRVQPVLGTKPTAPLYRRPQPPQDQAKKGMARGTALGTARATTRATTRATSGALAEAVAGFWRTVRSVLGAGPSERITQLVADAVLTRILIDRGAIDDVLAARAAADRDHTGLLFEHVLHARHGVPLEDLLGALAERRAIMGNAGFQAGPRAGSPGATKD